MKGSLFFILLLTLLPSLARAAEPEPIAKNDTIPDVAVRDSEGAAVQLRELVKRQPTLLIFYRGGWCPFCTRHLMALAEAQDDLAEAGFQILAVSPDRPEKLRETPDRDKLGYTLLSDSSMEAAKAFGITFKVADDLVTRYKDQHGIDLEAASGETHHLLPHPSVYLIDSKGIVRFAHVDPDYKKRLDPAEILETARKISAKDPR